VTTRLLVVTGVRLYSDGLKLLLEAEREIDVVGTAASDLEALESTIRLCPDVVLLDMELSGAARLLRAFAREPSRPKLIALGVEESDDGLVDCIAAGASGWVSRDGSLDQLVARIRSAARGEMDCSPGVAGRLAERVARLAAEAEPRGSEPHLTARESEIVGLIEEGLSNRQIAGRLSIELSTVKNHVHRILEKLGLSRRGEVAARARRGVLALEPRE
jgi:two-component system, NarL family, nitrate/nitrite response regulator NarL